MKINAINLRGLLAASYRDNFEYNECIRIFHNILDDGVSCARIENTLAIGEWIFMHLTGNEQDKATARASLADAGIEIKYWCTTEGLSGYDANERIHSYECMLQINLSHPVMQRILKQADGLELRHLERAIHYDDLSVVCVPIIHCWHWIIEYLDVMQDLAAAAGFRANIRAQGE